jgi:hypothetical protein
MKFYKNRERRHIAVLIFIWRLGEWKCLLRLRSGNNAARLATQA